MRVYANVTNPWVSSRDDPHHWGFGVTDCGHMCAYVRVCCLCAKGAMQPVFPCVACQYREQFK